MRIYNSFANLVGPVCLWSNQGYCRGWYSSSRLWEVARDWDRGKGGKSRGERLGQGKGGKEREGERDWGRGRGERVGERDGDRGIEDER